MIDGREGQKVVACRWIQVISVISVLALTLSSTCHRLQPLLNLRYTPAIDSLVANRHSFAPRAAFYYIYRTRPPFVTTHTHTIERRARRRCEIDVPRHDGAVEEALSHSVVRCDSRSRNDNFRESESEAEPWRRVVRCRRVICQWLSWEGQREGIVGAADRQVCRNATRWCVRGSVGGINRGLIPDDPVES